MIIISVFLFPNDYFMFHQIRPLLLTLIIGSYNCEPHRHESVSFASLLHLS